MYYIKRTPSENGNYGNPSSRGEIALTDELLSSYLDTMGFATVTVENDTVTAVTVNQTAYDAYMAENPPEVVTASKKRRQAYTTGEVDGTDWRIDYQDERKTCDELTLLGMQYYFRNETDAASAIRLLVEAKILEIRTAYPDEV